LAAEFKHEFVNSGLAVNSGLELDRCCFLVQFSTFAIKRCFADLFSTFALQFSKRSLWTIAKISKHRYKYNYGKLTLPHTMLNDADIGYHPCCVLYQATSRPKDKYSLCISMNRYISFILIVNGFLQYFVHSVVYVLGLQFLFLPCFASITRFMFDIASVLVLLISLVVIGMLLLLYILLCFFVIILIVAQFEFVI
jgi:hypothetical protein